MKLLITLVCLLVASICQGELKCSVCVSTVGIKNTIQFFSIEDDVKISTPTVLCWNCLKKLVDFSIEMYKEYEKDQKFNLIEILKSKDYILENRESIIELYRLQEADQKAIGRIHEILTLLNQR